MLYRVIISRMINRILVAIVILLAFSARSSSAQNRIDVLKSADRYNWFIRSNLQSGNSVEGRVNSLDSSRVVIDRTSILLSEISRVERRFNAGGGWKFGAGVGAGAGAVFGYGLAGLCESDCGGTQAAAILVFGGVGALLGGVIGQAIHPPRHYWKPVYPSD